MRWMGIEFAPLSVSLKRRQETLAALYWICLPTFSHIVFMIFSCYVLFFTQYYYLMCLYLVYLYLDKGTPQNGGRKIDYFKSASFWRHLVDYFPLRVVKTCDLPPDRNYLICSFPHGVLSANSCCHFMTNRSDFCKEYPRLSGYFAVLDFHFRTPLLRDYILALGGVSSSQKSLYNLLTSKKKGVAVGLAVGGAQEAFYAKPGSFKIILKKRKGFIKIALRAGASLVPAFSFGENDIFEQVESPPGSFLYKLQDYVKKLTGVAPIIPIGRGLFQYSYGIIPRRRPITTVFGAPIDLPLETEPSSESIDKYHQIFTDQLIALFEKHKHKFVENPENVHLLIE